MASCRSPDELEDAHLLGHALGGHRLQRLESKNVRSPYIYIFADQDGGAKLLVQSFEAGRKIHSVAERRVIHALRRPEVADHGFAHMNAKPRKEWSQAFGFKFGIDLLGCGLACKDRPASPLDMVGL